LLCICGCERPIGRCPVGVAQGHEAWRLRKAEQERAQGFRYVNKGEPLRAALAEARGRRDGALATTSGDWYESQWMGS
jgi:hypothetical protein